MKSWLAAIVAALLLGPCNIWADESDSDNLKNSALGDFRSVTGDDFNLLIRSGDGPPLVRFDEKCCKVCTKGKACGNSCINRDYQCHQPPGCACDG